MPPTQKESRVKEAVDNKIERNKMKWDPNNRDSNNEIKKLPENANAISDEQIRDYIVMLRN